MFSEVDLAFGRLASSDPEFRKLGAQALSRLLPHEKLLQIQTALLAEPEPRIAKWIALALGKIGDPSSIGFIEKKLNEVNEADAREWLLVSLRMLRPDGGAADLRPLLSGGSSEAIRRAVITAWENPDVTSDLDLGLIKAADHESSEIRRWSILSLGTTGRLVSADPVLHGLEDNEFLVREWTACALSRIKDPKAIENLVIASTDPHPRVREWAIKALAEYSDPEIGRILIKPYWKEEDAGCREAIIQVMGKHLGDNNVRRFLGEVARLENNRIVLVALIQAVLSHRQGREDVDLCRGILVRYWKDKDPVLRDEVQTRLFQGSSKRDQGAVRRVLSDPALRMLAAVDIGPASDDKSDPLVANTKLGGEPRPAVIGIIIPLKEELRYFRQVSPAMSAIRDPQTKQLYYKFHVQLGDGTRAECVVILLGAMSSDLAAAFSERILTAFRPTILVNVGIAASICSDVRLTDVIVAKEVDQYVQGGKAVTSDNDLGFEIVPARDPYKTDAALWQELMNFEFAKGEQYLAWITECSEDYRSSLKDSIRTKLEKMGLSRDHPAINEEIVASGPFVGASANFGHWLHTKFNRKYCGLEMEAGGVTLAAHYNRVRARTLILRGVSDLGDERKGKLDKIGTGAIRGLAVRNATRLLLRFLSHLDPADLDAT